MTHTRSLFFALSFSLFLGQQLLAQTTAQSTQNDKRIVVLGDSLTEGYGVSRESAFPALLQARLKAEGFKNWSVVNAGVSGATSASAASRLKWQLKSKPDLIILALGANDGLRGISPQVTRKNLSEAIVEIKKNKISVLLAGLQMPPNYGGPYRKEYAAVFPELAKEHKIPLIPFLLEGVAGEASLNLVDGIHPNEKGYVKVTDNVFKVLKTMIQK